MYGKLFASLFTGSMRGKGDLQLTFAYMIANCTEDGICDFTPQCIADATGKPLPEIEATIRELESPDEMSRTRTDEGRRIRRIDPERAWGWQIVNHKMYREIATRKTMLDAERKRKQTYRSEHPNARDYVGYVYFLRITTAVKIGFSTNPWARASELKTGCPEKPQLIGVKKGTKEAEVVLHKLFANDRLEGEWFKATPELLNYVVDYVGSCPDTPGRSASEYEYVSGSEEEGTGGKPDYTTYPGAIAALRSLHDDFKAVPDAAIENTLKLFDKERDKWRAAIETCCRHYAGVHMRKPCGHLQNFLEGRPVKAEWKKHDNAGKSQIVVNPDGSWRVKDEGE